MCEALAIFAVAAVVQITPAAASTSGWAFKTTDEAAYCRFEVGAFVCMRPTDGFWIRFTRFSDSSADIRKGYSERLKGQRGTADRVPGFGRVFYSSDAAIITCWSRRTGLTCKHYNGLSFWLGRYRGYRIFYDAPGFPPNVRPLFQTGHGIRCGINKDNLEPADPILQCWRPADGLGLGIAHGEDGSRRGDHHRIEKAVGFRPRGFPLLDYGRTFTWRCRKVTAFYAERCSTNAGEPVFTCTSTRARLTCQNRNGHGFWASARSFYTF